MSNSNRSHYT